MIQTALFADERALAIDELHAATALYTVRPIVDRLLDRIDVASCGRIIDPAAGDGGFLVPLLERIVPAIAANDVAHLASRIEAWELHPRAAADARSNVATTLKKFGWTTFTAMRAAATIVQERDFLTEGHDSPPADLIATNPPFWRMSRVPEILASDYRRLLAPFAAGDLLHAFLDRCNALLSPTGQLAFVTADRWLLNPTAGELREHLGMSVSLSHLSRLDASSSFYRPKWRRRDSPPRCHPVELILSRIDPNGRALSSSPIYPDVIDLPNDGPTLGDVVSMRLAPWLGTPGIFLVDATIAATLPAEDLIPAIDTEDLNADGSVQVNQRFALRTTRNNEPSTALRAHLDRTLHRMAQRGQRTPDWIPPELTTTLPIDSDMLVVPRIAKRLRTHRVPAGNLPVNHNLVVIPYSEALEAYLNGPECEAWIAARAPRLENEYLSITTKLLRGLPAPQDINTCVKPR